MPVGECGWSPPCKMGLSAPATPSRGDGAPCCQSGDAHSRGGSTLTAFTLSASELALYFVFSCAEVHRSSSAISFLCATMILLAMSRISAFFPFFISACAMVTAI